VAALVALLLVLAGVAAAVVFSGVIATPWAPAAKPVPTAADTRPEPPRMPDAVGGDVQSIAASLTATGVKVRIVLPARQTGLYASPDPSDEGTELVLPEVAVTFGATDTPGPRAWSQYVATQQPAAGTQLTRSDTVILFAGRHNGSPRGDAWYSSHAAAANEQGREYCVQCHDVSECLDCHLTYRHSSSVEDSASVETSVP
jgi:hypothetical protein